MCVFRYIIFCFIFLRPVPALNHCRKLGALVPTGKSAPVYMSTDKLYSINSTNLAMQYGAFKDIFSDVTKFFSARINRVWTNEWVDAEGAPVKPLALSMLQGRRPVILTEETRPLKYRYQCFNRAGVLPNPKEDYEFTELMELLKHLKLEFTFVNQFLNVSSHVSLLSNPSQIAMVLDDPSKWTDYIQKVLIYRQTGVYGKLAESSTKVKYLCFTLADVGTVSRAADQALKRQLNTVLHYIQRVTDLYQKCSKLFTNGAAGTNHHAKQVIGLYFPFMPQIIRFLKTNNFHVEEVVQKLVPDTAQKLEKLCEMFRTFFSRNFFRGKNMVQLDSRPDMFSETPATQFDTRKTMSISKVSGGESQGVLTLPLAVHATEYQIEPFLSNGRLFDFNYMYDSPSGRTVSRHPTPKNCSGPLDPACSIQPYYTCAKAFFHDQDVASCTRFPKDPQYRSSKIIKCSENDPAALAVTSLVPFTGTLDCYGNNDFSVNIPGGTTTWLQPCQFKTSNGNILNSLSGPVPRAISSPYFEFSSRVPSPVEKNTAFVIYVIILYFFSVLFLCIIFVAAGCWCYRRFRQQPGAPVGVPPEPANIPLNIIYANAFQAVPALPPPSSGFIESVE